MNFKSTLKSYQEQVNSAICELLPSRDAEPTRIHEAMLYSLEAGGKRLRPILLLASHNLYPNDIDPLPAAVAIECIHTYSLIHDDLPCMDNSPLRRGQPTSHIKFNEATALLAGDGLLTYAFYVISKHYKNIPEIACAMIADLAEAAGSSKLIGGQIEDFYHDPDINAYKKLDYIHANKTAALITSAITLGLRLARVEEEKISLAKELGFHLGMAFQINDDILDVTSNVSSLGKTPGLDEKNETLTYPKVYGIEKSIKIAGDHTNSALKLGQKIGGNNRFLLELIASLANRLV
ncbi:MAG: polyprenyl synthetase [Verrucomicrobia bacterium]|nr:MAG: polyprenyl synthetase [Verrucomicrobiota bacterium]